MKFLHEIVRHGNMRKPHSDIIDFDSFYIQNEDLGSIKENIEFVDQQPYLYNEDSQERLAEYRRDHIKDFLVIRSDERCEILVSTDYDKLIVKTPENPNDFVPLQSTQSLIPIGTKVKTCYVNGYEPVNVKLENSIFGRYHPDDYQGRDGYIFSCDTTNPNGYSVIIEILDNNYYRVLLDDEVLILVDEKSIYPEREALDIPSIRQGILEGRSPYVY